MHQQHSDTHFMKSKQLLKGDLDIYIVIAAVIVIAIAIIGLP
jgi:hypothetical protein